VILGMSSGARHRRLSPDETVQPGGSRGVNPAHHIVPVDFQDVAPKTRGVLQKIFLVIVLGQAEWPFYFRSVNSSYTPGDLVVSISYIIAPNSYNTIKEAVNDMPLDQRWLQP
jgi:hypothetical protein